MSISLYPELDAASRLGRPARALGAAELLVRNDDDIWPEFEGRDLSHLFHAVEFENAAIDGGTLDDLEGDQIRRLEEFTPDLVTLTVGGNDLLAILDQRIPREAIVDAIEDLQGRYSRAVERLRSAAPRALLILGTIYDPTDRTGTLPGWPPVPVALLEPLNDTIRKIASRDPNIELSDIHSIFMGHGVTAPVEERYYWSESIIEPSMLGANEIRRDWLAIVERWSKIDPSE